MPLAKCHYSYDAFSNPYVDSCSKQCNAFKTRAIQVKDGLLSAFPGISVLLNPEKVLLLGDVTSLHSY